MKILCRHDAQTPGFGVVAKGRTIDWPDGRPFPPHVLANFVAADGGGPLANPDGPKGGGGGAAGGGSREPTAEERARETARAEKAARDALVERMAALGRERLTAALDAAGQTYRAKATCAELATALLRAQGAID